MILVDFSSVLMANVFGLIKHMKSNEFNEEFFRKLTINSLLNFNKKFKEKYGEIIVACDGKDTWRKQYMPHYKHRRKFKQNDQLDWKTIRETFDKLIVELATYFPYRVIMINEAEADDVIGTLIHSIQIPHNNELIISTDKDMVQLLKFDDVKIYNPRTNMTVTYSDPNAFLIEQIIKGDLADDIPNMLSISDCFVHGIRQKTLRKDKLQQYIEDVQTGKHLLWNESVLARYKENELMIDLSLVPESIQMSIIDKYNEQAGKTRKVLYQYFMKNQLTEEMTELQYY